MRFWWVPLRIEITKVTGPNFTGLVSPNAGGIAVDGIKIRFGDIRCRTSKSSEIGPNFACFWPLKFFWGAPLKILDQHYKIAPSIDHRAKFHASRPAHLGYLALQEKTSPVKHKSFRKLSFSGGLIIIFP